MTNRLTTGRTGPLAVLLALILVLTGCVNVPTIGPVEQVDGGPPGCQNCVNVEVKPPTQGDNPQQIVDGYLRATSNYQPNYSVARQYLTEAAAQKWTPESGVSIYRGSATASGSSVELAGTLVGTLGTDRTYTARDQPIRVNFGLVNENGQWRIDSPPRGLYVAEYSFNSFYRPYNLYFLGNGNTLVPDVIYLPNLRGQANLASVLTKALLTGPSDWLRPVVATAIPGGTTLSVDAVTLTDGVAEVQLSEEVLQLKDTERGQLAAQVVYTLKQLPVVKAVRFRVNNQSLSVPGSDSNSFAVPVDNIPSEYDPIPFVAGEQLFAIRQTRVQRVSITADAPASEPVAGDLGVAGRFALDSIAVSVTTTDLAVVTDGRTVLRRATTTGGSMTTLLDGVTDLLRPQFTRFGEVWSVGRRNGRQQIFRTVGDRTVAVDAPILDGGEIRAFKISPDGSRIAVIRGRGAQTELGLGRISRSDRVTVDGWRALQTQRSSSAELVRFADVTWSDASTLAVLAASSADGAFSPYLINDDGSQVTSEGQAAGWDAVELTVLLRTQAAVVVGRDGQTYSDDGADWLPFIDNVTSIAFPG